MKSIHFALLTIYGIVALLSSCVSAHVASVKSPDFNKKAEKIFITIRGTESWMPFFEAYKSSLQTKFKERSVATDYHIFTPLSLEGEKDILAKISAYQPDVVLTITQTEMTETPGINGGYGGTFDAKMFEPGSDKPVWRANMKIKASWEVSKGAGTSAAKLIEKLVQDKVIN